jgi:hypothetical protein
VLSSRNLASSSPGPKETGPNLLGQKSTVPNSLGRIAAVTRRHCASSLLAPTLPDFGRCSGWSPGCKPLRLSESGQRRLPGRSAAFLHFAAGIANETRSRRPDLRPVRAQHRTIILVHPNYFQNSFEIDEYPRDIEQVSAGVTVRATL